MSDFDFEYIDKSDKEMCWEIKKFILRHEWLGKMPMRPTHRFIASYKGRLAGVIVMATPNTFSKMFGEENRNLEKLISRGACISWSPKNLGSALVMFAVRWMVTNTDFRFFTAYSDTEARELGTIYQACNFIYLGQKSGAREMYFDPLNPKRGWFSDRQFRKPSQVIKYLFKIGEPVKSDWYDHNKAYLDRMPLRITMGIKEKEREHQKKCIRRTVPPKHKYVYVLGRTKQETKKLRKDFKNLKPDLHGIPYPKYRGPQDNTAANIEEHI